jgi:uncharacterized membrane protein YraQ (UPF0718 family)
MQLLANKRIWIVTAVILATAFTFWGGSRYPSLDQKAIMGGSATLEDPLSFEASIQIQPDDGTAARILYTTINWIETNLQGMAFGLTIGACLLTLIGMIPSRGHRNGFVNTLYGLAIGVPLGVCVNCSAPVAKGMHDGGARLETTLATMFSSPTLNIVVLTMLFSIFPLYMTVIKLTLTLVLVLILVPLMSRFVFRRERAKTYDDLVCAVPPAPVDYAAEGFFAALLGAATQLLKNLLYVVIRTVPLMLLAGFLGAVVVHVLPMDTLLDFEPGVLSILLVALIGVFLPVPIAFDIVLTAVLVAAGAPMIYSMIFLFTLGIFSIYPFFIIWNTISSKVAVVLCLVIMCLGIVGGIIADNIHEAELSDMLEFLEEET